MSNKMELQVESTLFHTGDLVILQADSTVARHPIEIEAIAKGMVRITNGVTEWLTTKEFGDRKPVIVGRVEQHWWGKRRILT